MHRSQEPPNQRHLKDGKCESYLHHAHQMTMVEVTSASASAQVHHSVPRNSASVVACHVESAWGCSDRVAAVCLDMSGHVRTCPDMSGHSQKQNGVITEKNAKIFAPAAGFCLRRRLRRASQNPVSTSTGSPCPEPEGPKGSINMSTTP